MFIQFIIPYYGSSKLLITAVDSIFKQTDTDDIGLIVIDDNHKNLEGIAESTVALEYLQHKTQDTSNQIQIKYIKNEQNLGVGKTRNVGLLHSFGAEYVAFLDSDDELSENFVSTIRTRYTIHPSNVYIGKYIYNVGDTVCLANALTWLHGKVYKVDFLRRNNIVFPPIRFNEDSGFNLMVYEMTKNIHTLSSDDAIYWWKENPESLTYKHTDLTYSALNYAKSMVFAVEHILKKYEINQVLRIPSTILQLYRFYCQLLYNNCAIEEVDKEMVEFFRIIHHTEWYNSDKQKKQLEVAYFDNDSLFEIIPEITLAEFVSKFEKEPLNFR